MSQDARCWYYRNGWTCYRAGGNYATPTRRRHESGARHFDADRCVAVNPSERPRPLSPRSADDHPYARETREVMAQDYFIGPGYDITRMTVLGPGDLLTAIRIPATWAGARFYFEKVRDRQVWDFPLVNIASATVLSGDRIDSMRLAVNAVAAHPVRLTQVEDAVRGKPRNETTADMAARLAIEGARPLRHNGYKVTLVRNLVKRAIRGKEEPWA